MIPTNSSGTTNGCDNISSNCVVWQGPDIACINLCSGDTISEVTAKIATKVCDIITNGVISNPSLAGLDLTCLNISGTTPTTLVPVLQAMVTQICLNITSSNTPVGSTLPIMTLPKCLEYNDANGNPVTQLRLDLFATLIAQQVCTNLSSINLINSTLTSYSNRLDVLEACVLPCSGAVTEVQIIPTCVSNIGQLTNVSIVVQALESAYCTLVGGTGTVAQMNLAIGQSSITSASPTRNNSAATYSSISGWNSTPTTLAQSLQNAWVVIDDLYAAVGNIQTNCCASGCTGVTFAYTNTTSTAGNGTISSVNFDFTGSTIPNTFTDSAGFSLITLTDALGASLSSVVSVSSLQNNSSGFNFPTPSPFNTQQDFTVQVSFSVTDGVDTCTSDQTSQLKGLVPCPLNIAAGSVTTTGVVVTFTNSLGTTAVYLIEIIDVSTNQVTTSVTVNNPPASISESLSGLTANTAYKIRVTTTFGGATQICPTVNFSSITNNAPCGNGMDVAFVVDYTSSNVVAVQNLQAGASALIATINGNSGGNVYRMSLVTSDQTTGSLSAYSACGDYTGLPAAQRLSAQISTGAYNHTTAWEMFQNDNGSTWTSQLNKLNGGVGGGCIQMGTGIGTNSPTNYASDLVTGATNFTNAFRAGVAKYVVIATDKLPGGTSQAFNQTVWSEIQQTIADANIKGIKYIVVGPGVDLSANISGTVIYPWRELANQTSGGYNNVASAGQIQQIIVNTCT
jgi:hypothetical protein